MKNNFKFLVEVGKLKVVARKGLTFYGVKNPDSATDHSFRMAMIVWLLSERKRFNVEKAIKMALIHDISKIIVGDITPYDGLLPEDKKERERFVRKWRRLSVKKKQKMYLQKFKKEYKALKKLISKLPSKFQKEVEDLWLDYHQNKSIEAKLVSQIDMLENLLEALEHYKKNRKFPTKPWWEHAEEIIDDPIILDLLKEIEKAERKINLPQRQLA
jgi:putative hydrolase of HD superfamily